MEDSTNNTQTMSKNDEFILVGCSKFVRTNPLSDRFPILSFHHVEFWCGDATSFASRFSLGLGLPLVARSDLSTGNSVHCSLLLHSHSIKLLFTAPYPNYVPNANPSIPSFDAKLARTFVSEHGFAVRAIAVKVPSAYDAFDISVRNGAVPTCPPSDLGQGFVIAEVKYFADVVLRFVSENPNPNLNPKVSFLPGFAELETDTCPDYGLRGLDHVVGNVDSIGPVVSYVSNFTGFHEFAEFTAEDVGTAESGLNSYVMANNSETILLPINEPTHGTKRRSPTQTFLDYNGGPGVHHVAVTTDDIVATLRKMKAVTGLGGFDFMPPPPPNYYDGVMQRVGDVITAEQLKDFKELGISVDRDDQGTLLQIFTKPAGDRPTFILEIMQRVGCMTKDEQGKEYQKGGCGGFGKGNIIELFKSIEEYEKSLEVKPKVAALLVS